MDLIFPNRNGGYAADAPGHPRVQAGLDAWRSDAERDDRPTTSHRRSGRMRRVTGLLRRRTKVVQVSSGRAGRRGLLADLPIGRRRLLMGIGTGAVVATGAGAATTFIANAFDSQLPHVGPTPRRTGSARKAWPTLPPRLPGLPPMRLPSGPLRSTATPSCTCCGGRPSGRPWSTSRRLNSWASTPGWSTSSTRPAFADPVGDAVLALYPTIAMTTAQIRKAVKAYDYDAMYELGRATLARQMWSTRQLSR